MKISSIIAFVTLALVAAASYADHRKPVKYFNSSSANQMEQLILAIEHLNLSVQGRESATVERTEVLEAIETTTEILQIFHVGGYLKNDDHNKRKIEKVRELLYQMLN